MRRKREGVLGDEDEGENEREDKNKGVIGLFVVVTVR